MALWTFSFYMAALSVEIIISHQKIQFGIIFFFLQIRESFLH